MTKPDPEVRDALDDAYRREWAQVLATTVRVAGDLDVAEECVQEAFVSALTVWGADGVPSNPGAWLTTVARRKAIDQLRRASTARAKLPVLLEPETAEDGVTYDDAAVIPDDRLRLIFTCCHPALASETQIALTLRLVCGLPTPVIARSFLVSEPTMAARITRGKKKIQVARIPYAMPSHDDLSLRLDAVLTVIYLFFTAGHTRNSGESLVDDAIVTSSLDLARMLSQLMRGEPEVQGLLALMLLTDARRGARVAPDGSLVLLADQDRSLWDRAEIAEGLALVRQALASRSRGRFTLQAAIAAAHSSAATPEQTDWSEIVDLYTELLKIWPSPVVALNRAVAVAEVHGPQAALVLVNDLVESGELSRYPYLWSTRAELQRRLRHDEAAGEDYRKALSLVDNDVERAFLQVIEGEKSPEQIAKLARGKLLKKKEDLLLSLDGRISDRHRFLLRKISDHIQWLDKEIAVIDGQIVAAMNPYEQEWKLLQTIPGIDEMSAAMLLIEIGVDMSRFGSKERLSSWAGMCPGSSESAGKHMSGRMRKGNPYVRSLLCEIANSARKTDSQFKGLYQGLVIRRGHKRAIMAIGHRILEIIYILISRKEPYRDRTIDYEALVVKRNAPRWIQALVKYGYLKRDRIEK